MATGNPGMPTPYDQGVEHGKRGMTFEQIYDQPEEEVDASDYQRGYDAGISSYALEQARKYGLVKKGRTRR